MVAAGAKGVPMGIAEIFQKIDAPSAEAVTFLLADLRPHPYTVLRLPPRVVQPNVE
jgi:hypothetical protein